MNTLYPPDRVRAAVAELYDADPTDELDRGRLAALVRYGPPEVGSAARELLDTTQPLPVRHTAYRPPIRLDRYPDAARRPLTQAELLLVGQYANRRDNLDVDELENLAAMYRVANDDSEVKLLVDVLKPSVAKIAQNEASERMNAARHKVEHLPWKRPTLSVQARQRLADAVASEIAAELGDLPDAAGLGHDAAVRLLADADRNAEHAWQHHRASLTNVSRGRDPLPPAA